MKYAFIARRRMGEDIKTVQLRWPLGMPLVRKMEPMSRAARRTRM